MDISRPTITDSMRYALAHLLIQHGLPPDDVRQPDEIMRTQYEATFTERGIATYVDGLWFFQSLTHQEPRLIQGVGLDVGRQCPQGRL